MSRFVSAGNVEPNSEREDAWKKAQEAIEASKKRQEDAAAGSGLQEGGKTLFEVLQANKAAKQDAFEESLRLKNQVQFLNEEDEEYLESLSRNERAQKAATAKEAREQLAAFRKQQDDAEKKVAAGTIGGQDTSAVEEGESWSISTRKRKKGKEQDFIKGIKLRKTSSTDQREAVDAKNVITATGVDLTARISEKTDQSVQREVSSPVETATNKPDTKAVSPVLALGLGAYSSDEDD